MSDRVSWIVNRGSLTAILSGWVWCAAAVPVGAITEGEARFFAGCPHGASRSLHSETNPWDLHAIGYSVLGLTEVEILRTVDWIVDLPLPGQPLRPTRHLVLAARAGYAKLPAWWLTWRTGELIDALQIPELSFGDALGAYTAAVGGAARPGSGMLIRADRLVDWSQHLVDDLNRGAGWVVWYPARALTGPEAAAGWPRSPRDTRLVPWSFPGRAVDWTQGAVIKVFNRVTILLARVLEAGFTGVEWTGERLVNAGHRAPHADAVVFLRLPLTVFRAHETWLLEHQARLVVGTPAQFRAATHAALGHRRRRTPENWDLAFRAWPSPEPVVVMTPLALMRRAPRGLQGYVVPAAWILNAGAGGEGPGAGMPDLPQP